MLKKMKLYSYWRSSAAYRVRIALNLKGLDYEVIPIHLLKDGGEQFQAGYRSINPQGILPTLVDGDVRLGQSLAIIDYLEARFPEPPLYPQEITDRALVQQVALAVACDIHPLNNLRVLKYLKHGLQQDDEAKDTWYHHWINTGFTAIEELLGGRDRQGPFCLDGQVTVADICLVPQIYNARRFKVPMEDFPALAGIEQACQELEAFRRAAPENQVDANT